jgi:hypothetical protein
MGNCLQQPGQLHHDEQHFANNISTTYQILCTGITPAAETKSIGLLANAPLSWFLHRHQDNLIMT